MCRRTVKPVYDPDKFEYKISEFQDWTARPSKDRSPGLTAAYHSSSRLKSSSNQGSIELTTFKCLQQKLWDDPASLSAEEFEFLKAREPDL
jgi:hypothetical protein